MLVPMKRLTLYALKDDREALLLALQKDGNVMLIQTDDKTSLPGAEEVTSQLDKAKEAIHFLDSHGAKKSLLAPKLAVPYQQFLLESKGGQQAMDEAENLASQIATLRNEGATLLSQAESLNPWLKLDIPLEELKGTETTDCFVGYLPEEDLEGYLKATEKSLVDINRLGIGPEGIALVVIAHKSQSQEIKHILKEHNFTEALLPKGTGLATQVVRELKTEAEKKEKAALELESKAKEIAGQKDQIALYADQLAAKGDRLANGGTETIKTFCLHGWVRHDRTQQVETAVKSVTDAYELTFREPKEGEIPPSVMENNKLVAPYESVVELYSRPKVGTVDPDLMMAPFHFIFFGMMLSDAGYGLVLTIALFIAMKLFKPQGFAGKLTMVIFFGSISTVIWGAMFGGWFGLEWHPLLFVPMNEPIKMLVLCFGLGAIHLVCGMLIKVYTLIKAGDIMGAVCDQISWLIMFAGFFCMGMAEGPIGKYLALFGAAIILLFGGREKKGIISRLIGGLLSLYNISSYLSDLLSYSRIFALGLATGVIGMVINTIAQMLLGMGPVGVVVAVLLLIGGHTFNIIINVLGAFVHSSRLQYIEFFGKFFEAGGRAFVPLALRTKYTEVTK
ncbi:MAG: V-type ATP synthase subunit I [Acidaminococcaceae bacterium]|jgi:V/A-type H+-transporting ATPase subunit I|nr:V-type ATP synthase subunit I [Acidaminococcaceae bacterium]